MSDLIYHHPLLEDVRQLDFSSEKVADLAVQTELEASNQEVPLLDRIYTFPYGDGFTIQHGTISDDPKAKTCMEFLCALFENNDWVLIRPLESYEECGKKKANFDYKNTCHRTLYGNSLEFALPSLFENSEKNMTNLFFGVCPRNGGKSQYDLAWQIRTVRALWVDIDHISYADALKSVNNAKLPPPSVAVNSGNGVHFYWLLTEPYLIDDAGTPSAVLKDWVRGPNGKKKPFSYIKEDGEKILLKSRPDLTKLSPKAEFIQNVIKGLALACAGDHVSDLVRLLRLPGSYNRKNQRNGREPILTELLVCNPNQRYPLSDFEAFAEKAPKADSHAVLDKIALPLPRKTTQKQKDQFTDLRNKCVMAAAGNRSETDFALCCFAVRNGMVKTNVWEEVKEIGKFAERGYQYFELTWNNAETDCRMEIVQKLSPKSVSLSDTGEFDIEYEQEQPPGEENLDCAGPKQKLPVIVIDESSCKVSKTLSAITNYLVESKYCFRRLGNLVAVRPDLITYVHTANELAGLLNEFVEFCYQEETEKRIKSEYKPLTSNYANTWLNKHSEIERLPLIRMFTKMPSYSEDWNCISPRESAH